MKAIITGAANGIGKRLAQRLKPTSEILWLVDHNFKKGIHEAKTGGCTVIECGVDVRVKAIDTDGLDDVTDSVIDRGGKLNALINNAGHNVIHWIPDVRVSEWHQIVETNLTAPFFWSQRCLPFMRASAPPRRIINLTSIAAHQPHRASSAYNASKAGLLMLTRQMARELAPDIVVTSVSPCFVEGTKMTKELWEELKVVRSWTEQQLHQYNLQYIPANRYATVDDVADVVEFLLSPQAEFLTGIDIQVSGGMR